MATALLLTHVNANLGGVATVAVTVSSTLSIRNEFLSTAICNSPCPQNAACVSPNVCQCNPGWAGPNCDIRKILSVTLIVDLLFSYMF
jgi:hypothetical protein